MHEGARPRRRLSTSQATGRLLGSCSEGEGATSFRAVAEEVAAEVEEKDRRYGRAVLRGVEVLKILYPEGVRPDQYADAFLTLRLFEKRSRIASAQDDDLEDARRDSLGYCLVDVVQHRNR